MHEQRRLTVGVECYAGHDADDSKKLFNAGLEGNTWRAIDFREGDKIDKTALEALLHEAMAYNTKHSVLF